MLTKCWLNFIKSVNCWLNFITHRLNFITWQLNYTEWSLAFIQCIYIYYVYICIYVYMYICMYTSTYTPFLVTIPDERLKRYHPHHPQCTHTQIQYGLPNKDKSKWFDDVHDSRISLDHPGNAFHLAHANDETLAYQRSDHAKSYICDSQIMQKPTFPEQNQLFP